VRECNQKVVIDPRVLILKTGCDLAVLVIENYFTHWLKSKLYMDAIANPFHKTWSSILVHRGIVLQMGVYAKYELFHNKYVRLV